MGSSFCPLEGSDIDADKAFARAEASEQEQTSTPPGGGTIWRRALMRTMRSFRSTSAMSWTSSDGRLKQKLAYRQAIERSPELAQLPAWATDFSAGRPHKDS